MNDILRSRCAWIVVAAFAFAAPAFAQQPPADALDAKTAPEAEAFYDDAANLHNNSEYELAAEQWREFLKKYPKDPLGPKVRLYLGVSNMQLKQTAEAEKEFRTLVDKYPKFDLREEALLNLGGCEYALAQAGAAEKYAAAAKTFASLAEDFPTGRYADQALYFQGESLVRQDKKPEAIAAYKQLMERFAQSEFRADALYSLGVTYEELQQFADAGKVYDTFLKEFAKHDFGTEVGMRKGETVLRAGMEAEAAGKAEIATTSYAQASSMFAAAAAMKDFRAADHALMRQAFTATKQKKLDEAANLYAQLPESFPQSAYVAEARTAAGRIYYRSEKYDEAAKVLEQVAQQSGPEAAEAAHWLCRVYLQKREPTKAAELASGALAKAGDSPLTVQLKMDLADAQFETEATKPDALKLFTSIATDHPDSDLAPQALYSAAYAAQELKQYDAALASADSFLKRFPNDALAADVRYVAAECLLVQGKYPEAEKAYQELIAANPSHAEFERWQVRHGLALYLQQKYDETIASLSKLLGSAKKPDHVAEARFLIGASQFYQDKFAEAVESLQASLAADADWRQADETLLLLARAQRRQDKLDDAIASAKKMLATFPQTKLADQAHYRLGEFAFAKNDFPTAIAEYEAVRSMPDSAFAPYALYGVGWSQLKAKDYAAAAKTLTEFLDKNPEHSLAAEARFARAMSRRQAGDLPAAIEDIDTFLKTKPGPKETADALYERGLVEVAMKDYAAAGKTLSSILTDQPEYVDSDKVLYELGWVYKSQDKTEESLPYFQKLTEAHADSPLAAEAFVHVGDAQYGKKAYDEAAKLYASAQQKAGKSALGEKATYKLGWCSYQQQQYEPALVQFAAEVNDYPDGALAGESRFMKAECLFKLKKFDEAYQAFAAARESKLSSPTFAVLALLHGGQSASQLKKWDETLKLVSQVAKEYPDSPYLAEAIYEQGWARQNLNQTEDALKDFDTAALKSRGETGARSRYMMGELLFAQKQHTAAVKEFTRAMFGYGGEAAAPEIKQWQAKAGYEAGRCSEVAIASAADGAAKAAAVAAAKKHYTYVVEKHPKEEIAAEAQKRLDVLAKF